MARKGRKPKPTALKILEGNPGRRPILPDPRPERVVLPRCPEHIDDLGRREWNRVARAMFTAGLLTQLDRAGLAAYCVAWSRWVKAEEALARVPALIIKSKAGGMYQNPYLGVAQAALRDLMRTMAELGLSPTSRPRATGAGTPFDAHDPVHAQYGL
jgi:P27 family predicted phage terminase small subunit